MYALSNLEPFGAELRQTGRAASLLEFPVPELAALVEEHKILVLRGFESLSTTDLRRAARRLGPLLEWEFGEVLDLKINRSPANHLFGAGRVELHWDGAYLEELPRFNLFQCLDSAQDAEGGETLFVDTVGLVERTDGRERALWEETVIDYSTNKAAHYSGAVTVPLLGSHRHTNKSNIRFIEPYNEDNAGVNPVSIRVHGMEGESQEPFLRGLIDRLYADDVMYRHRWKRGDFLVVDNDAVLHGRSKLKGNVRRHLQRVHVMDPHVRSTQPLFITG